MFTVYKYNKYYLKLIKKNVDKKDLSEYGKITAKIHNDYENGLCVGYILEGFYAIKET